MNAQEKQWGVTHPPLGWNSWDCYGTTVTETEVIANAEFMATHLREYGWDTIVIDIAWADPQAKSHGYNDDADFEIDNYGRLLPAPNRFPSARDGNGFGPLANKIHDLGLRFGIHTMRGIPRVAVNRDLPVFGTDATARDIANQSDSCEWNPDMWGLDLTHPAAQSYYDSTLALYASWGVDFIKADDMLWPYHSADIEAYQRAIQATGQPIFLSLSPGRDLSLSRELHLQQNANSWRICDDLWDNWDDILANFSRFARWTPHATNGHWPDGDMLPLGRIGIRAERGEARDSQLTTDEAKTLLTLWAMGKSPLMFGGDLPSTLPETIDLLRNSDVLEIVRSSTNNRELFREGHRIIWGATGADGRKWAAVFNCGDSPETVTLDVQDLGFAARPTEIRDLWDTVTVNVHRPDDLMPQRRGIEPVSSSIDLKVPAHGVRLLRSC